MIESRGFESNKSEEQAKKSDEEVYSYLSKVELDLLN